MSLADELQKLDQLHKSGALTEGEYESAKAAVLAAAKDTTSIELPAGFWSRPTVWAALIHASVLMGYLIPLAGFVAPIVLWQTRKEDAFVDMHGRIVMNAILSFLIWGVVSVGLVFFMIGVPMLWVLGVLVVALPLIGAVRAFQGKVWEYPLTISFFRVPSPAGLKP